MEDELVQVGGEFLVGRENRLNMGEGGEDLRPDALGKSVLCTCEKGFGLTHR